MPVSMPKRRPIPTANSPQVTRNEKNPAFGITICCKNHAYQPWTAGLAPELFAKAPVAKPVKASPLVPQAGEIIFSHPARNHSEPTYMRTTNHKGAEPAEATKNFEMAGSGNCSVESTALRADRSWKYCTNAKMSERTNRMSKAMPQ